MKAEGARRYDGRVGKLATAFDAAKMQVVGGWEMNFAIPPANHRQAVVLLDDRWLADENGLFFQWMIRRMLVVGCNGDFEVPGHKSGQFALHAVFLFDDARRCFRPNSISQRDAIPEEPT